MRFCTFSLVRLANLKRLDLLVAGSTIGLGLLQRQLRLLDLLLHILAVS